MRIQSSLRNLLVALVGQMVGLILSFILRIVFIRELGVNYLGLNALFTNIVSIMSLVELGIGPAMIFSLYKPLANNNKEEVKSLMKLYQKVYIIVGIIIIIIGGILTPFITFFTSDKQNLEYIHIIFLLFVLNTAITYFYAYKRSLIIADQKRYIATFYRYLFFAILNVLQILILFFTGNFILFLLCQFLTTFAENIIVSRTADRLFPYLKEKNVHKLRKDVLDEIKKNVKAMVAHRLGGVVVNSTDSIIISKFVGLKYAGLFSNYQLIISALNIVISQFFLSITASVGNLGATETESKKKQIFNIIYFINFWIYGFSAICLVVLVKSFIGLWLGKDYILDNITVFFIILNFYLGGMRKSVLTFKDAFGLYYYDRHKPILEAIINLVFSIILVYKFDITGVIIGTTISTITTCLWVEPFVLFKYGFKSSSLNYFGKYILYFLVTFFTCIVTFYIANLLSINSIFDFIFKLIVCLLLPNLIFTLLFFKSKEFNYVVNLLKTLIFSRRNKVSN